jgi:hypothetical protein
VLVWRGLNDWWVNGEDGEMGVGDGFYTCGKGKTRSRLVDRVSSSRSGDLCVFVIGVNCSGEVQKIGEIPAATIVRKWRDGTQGVGGRVASAATTSSRTEHQGSTCSKHHCRSLHSK